MPPRLPSSSISTPPTSLCSSCHHQLRPFSHTLSPHATFRRRRFYDWLNGPGKQLKHPLPGSTNYLGAYDRYGNLHRAGAQYDRAAAQARQERENERRYGVVPGSSEWEAREAREAALQAQAEGGEGEAGKVEGAESEEKGVEALEASVRDAEGSEDDAATVLSPESTNDLRPFPENKFFKSQPVLSEELREAIWRRVKEDGATVPLASVEFGVSNERVGAVVRLKQMEKEWVAQGKILALPYSRAVLSMLPTTPYIDPSLAKNKNVRPLPHEPINDLPVHPATRQQLWVPVSESRQYTREDAGKAFANHLLPADARIPHPNLVHAERDIALGLSFSERTARAAERLAKDEAVLRAAAEKKARDRANLNVIPQRRWDFVVEDVSIDPGRGASKRQRDALVGWRYGVPHQDRKKGIVKIPTSVEA